MRTRLANVSDLRAIAEIYNDGIRERVATFETVERTPEDIREWLGSRLDPVVVAELDGGVVGWARASEYRRRSVYSGVREFSVYVAGAARRKGAGDALLRALIDACATLGHHKLVSRVFPENTASRALCRRHGFREVGTYERHGQLDGHWRDVIIVERLIARAPQSGWRAAPPQIQGEIVR